MSTKDYIKSLTREDLETVALNIVNTNYFSVQNIVGEPVCNVVTNMPEDTFLSVLNNIRCVYDNRVTVERVLDEVESRGFYIKVVSPVTFKIPVV